LRGFAAQPCRSDGRFCPAETPDSRPGFADHENRQPTKALRKQAHCGNREICNFNQDSASREDGNFKCLPAQSFGRSENLRYLPSVVGSDSGSQTTPLYYVYDYDGTSITAAKATANYNTYGVLYNWEAAKAAVPDGWHLPTHDEWLQLTSNTGGYTSAGGRLKEKGTMHWVSPNAGASDQFGFTALPGGSRYYDSTFINIGKSGYWWSATDIGNYKAYSRRILNWESVILDEWFGMERGFSVRCVRD
jgi:uncharacterized protein (TIGR02145 family)